MNYYVGVLKLKPKDYATLDKGVRAILTYQGIYLQPACLERLYMSRDEMKRGLHNIKMRGEQMLPRFSTYLQAKAPGSTRSHLSNIKEYLRVRYAMAEEVMAIF
ncbi:hypothetical protein PAEPH01_0182 [Pancytospora epiphaga]|nr:hypothetical protein PAEPH01_0182 [Pancytospora epiphaga]